MGLGLVTCAIDHGRVLAEHIHARLMSAPNSSGRKSLILYERIRTECYEAFRTDF